MLVSPEEVIGTGHYMESLGLGYPVHQTPQQGGRGEGVVFTYHKHLGSGECMQRIGVEIPGLNTQPRPGVRIAEFGIIVPRSQANGRDGGRAGIILGNGESHPGAKGVAHERYSHRIDARLGQKPIQGTGDIGLFTPAVVVLALTTPNSSEVEAQGHDSLRGQRQGYGHDQPIAHTAATQWMGMAYNSSRTFPLSVHKVQDTLEPDRVAFSAGKGYRPEHWHGHSPPGHATADRRIPLSVTDQLGDGDARATLSLRSLAMRLDQWMADQLLLDCLPQHTCSFAMNDAH